MGDDLTEVKHRERNLINSDADNYNGSPNTNRSWRSRLFSRLIPDNNDSDDQHQNSHLQLPNNDNDTTSLRVLRTPKPLSASRSLHTTYDSDGVSRNTAKHHHNSSNNYYEHLISPRLAARQPLKQLSRQQTADPRQHRLSQKVSFSGNSSPRPNHKHDDRDEDPNYDNETRRLNRHNHRAHHSPILNGNHEARFIRSSAVLQRGGPLAVNPSVHPLRIIFMRHSERVNQALGPDWFNRAFRTNAYVAYDPNLPSILPKRRFDKAYEFDAPLTVRGLKGARLTGRSMLQNNLVADVCLSSTALRCVQTCERILTGMERRDRIPIRIEPGLFECPHFNHKIVESFMTKTELMENRYNIKHEYKPLIAKVTVPETLDEYFERSITVMRGIIDRYGPYGGTVLIVTHAPGLLALTGAIKGLRPNIETFYRTVSAYPPLSMYIAEYDGSKWKYSEKPFALVSI